MGGPTRWRERGELLHEMATNAGYGVPSRAAHMGPRATEDASEGIAPPY